MNRHTSLLFSFFFIFSIYFLSAQPLPLTEKEAVEQALQNNPQMRISTLRIERQRSLINSAFSMNNLEIIFQSPTGDGFRPGILQSFEFPTVYTQQLKLQRSNVNVAKAEKGITTNNLIYGVRTNYNMLNFLIEKFNALKRQDSIFSDIIKVNEIRYRVGQISNLEKINGEAYYKQIQFNLIQTMADLQNSKIQMAILIGRPEDTTVTSVGKLTKIIDYEINQIPDTTFETNPLTTYYNQQRIASQGVLGVERNRRFPRLIVGYLNQTYDNSLNKYGFQFGIGLPIWYWTYGSRINAARKDVEIVKTQSTLNNYVLKGEYSKELAQYRQYSTAVGYFETVGIAQANEILKSARESYRLGSIGYYIYLQNLNQAFQIQLNALEALKNYNQSIITLQYLLGESKY